MKTTLNTTLRALTVSCITASLVGLTFGCATAPSELETARATYAQVKKTNAPVLAPDSFADATQALERAEEEFEEEGDGPMTQAFAYTADRKARRALLDVEQHHAEDRMAVHQDRLAAMLAQQLKNCAKVEQVAGDTVISISGAILFEFGKAQIREHAKRTLDVVADALVKNPGQRIVIEGHADSVGDEDFNLELSEARAEAVLRYLESQGVSPLRLTATGAGESEPVASNDNPEGRANNRRVEIILVSPNTASR